MTYKAPQEEPPRGTPSGQAGSSQDHPASLQEMEQWLAEAEETAREHPDPLMQILVRAGRKMVDRRREEEQNPSR